MKKRIYCLIFSVLILGTSTFASELTIGSVEDAIQIGLQSNPGFQAQLNVLRSKEMLPRKLGSLSDPNIGIRLNGTPAKNSDYSFDQKRYFVNQSFPFLGELGRKKRLGEKEIKISTLDLELSRSKITLMIQKIYFGLVLNKELIEITKKNNQILENLINIADIKYRAGKTLQANVLKAKVSKGKLEEQLLQLTHQKVKLTEELKKWLGQQATDGMNLKLQYPDSDSLAVLTPSPPIVSESLMVQKATAMKDKADQMVAVEKDRYLPNFMAQVEVWDNAGMDNQYGGQLAMSIPWFNGKNDASVKEAKAMSRSKDKLMQDTFNDISRKLTTWASELKTTQETLKLYETEILQNARLSLSSFQKAFEVDKASFLDYFESEKTLYALEMQHAKLVNKKHVLRAQINALFAKGDEK